MNRTKQLGRYGDFWAKVDKTDSCWLWAGAKKVGLCNGPLIYGKAWHENKLQKAHRVSWALTFGEIPDGLCVLHRCDVPLCVRPDHLWLGTKADNNRDAMMKRRGLWKSR